MADAPKKKKGWLESLLGLQSDEDITDKMKTDAAGRMTTRSKDQNVDATYGMGGSMSPDKIKQFMDEDEELQKKRR